MSEPLPFKKKKRNNYVDNERLLAAMIEHIDKYKAAKESGTELPRVSNYIGSCIQLIAQNLSLNRNFIGYTYRDDMIMDGIETCLKYLHNFNYEKYKNPFAYFTQIIYYSFLYRIDKEKKESYIKYKSMMNSSVMNSLVEMPADDAEHFQTILSTMDPVKMQVLFDKYETVPKVKSTSKSKKGVEKFIGEGDE